jgi:N-acetylglutamate synthase-like GNAT family acetyltransferase
MPVRDALPDDWPAIEALLRSYELPLEGAREHLALFSVYEDGQVRGCAGAEIYGRVALLRSVAVAADARGNGAGRALVQRTLTRLEANGVTSVALLTTDAESYFRAFGFQPIVRESLPPKLNASAELRGACPASAVAMLLHLWR